MLFGCYFDFEINILVLMWIFRYKSAQDLSKISCFPIICKTVMITSTLPSICYVSKLHVSGLPAELSHSLSLSHFHSISKIPHPHGPTAHTISSVPGGVSTATAYDRRMTTRTHAYFGVGWVVFRWMGVGGYASDENTLIGV